MHCGVVRVAILDGADDGDLGAGFQLADAAAGVVERFSRGMRVVHQGHQFGECVPATGGLGLVDLVGGVGYGEEDV